MRKRMIRLLSLFAAAFAFVSCDSEQGIKLEKGNDNPNLVSIEEAMADADAMYSKVYGGTRSGRKPSGVIRFRSRTTRGEGNANPEGYYIVNYIEGGFSLLSADRRDMNRVYAISDEGALHLTDTVGNPGLSMYINDILPMLTNTIGAPSPDKYPIDSLRPIDPGWSYYKKHSDPLLTGFMARFHQFSPYNHYCNTGAPDYKPQYVGCVPLAVGTVMGYHKWPQSLDGYTFDWDAMRNSADDLRWARLFKILGGPEYTNVSYGIEGESKGTGVPYYRISKAFTDAFTKANYKGGHTVSFSSAPVSQELESNNPVICVGNNGEGHAWVIDGGYTTGSLEYPVTPDDEKKEVYRSYYHCVWGWGGLSNGYYLYSGSLGGNIEKGDPEYGTSASKYNDLLICYGYKPNK